MHNGKGTPLPDQHIGEGHFEISRVGARRPGCGKTKIGEARIESSGRARVELREEGKGKEANQEANQDANGELELEIELESSRERSEGCAPCVPSRNVRHLARAIGTRSRPRRLKAVSFPGSVPSSAVVSTHA